MKTMSHQAKHIAPIEEHDTCNFLAMDDSRQTSFLTIFSNTQTHSKHTHNDSAHTRLGACAHTHTHDVCAHACTHAYTHTHIHTHTHDMCTRTHTLTLTLTHTHTHS